jgi:hypothetical protein
MKPKDQNVVTARRLTRHAFSLVTLVAASLSAPYVQADTLPAISGHVWINPNSGTAERMQDLTCFTSSRAQVSNTCEDWKTYLIPLPIRRSGIARLTVQVNAVEAHVIFCRAFVIGVSNNSIRETNAPGVSNTRAGNQPLDLGPLDVPPAATLQFECRVSGRNRAQLINVNWTQPPDPFP